MQGVRNGGYYFLVCVDMKGVIFKMPSYLLFIGDMFYLYKRAVCNTHFDVYCQSKRLSGKAKQPAGEMIVERLSVRCPLEQIFTVMQCEIRSPNRGNDGSSSAAGQMRSVEHM